jgi:hypothetical protein
VPLLAAMPSNLADGHSIDADVLESFLNLFEFEGLHNGFDLFHFDAIVLFRVYDEGLNPLVGL